MIKASDIIKQISSGSFDSILSDIDPDCARLEYEKGRFIRALETFISNWGDGPVSVFSAPGRSEVCGNHTDHQLGEVLACSINRDAIGIASLRDDGKVQLISDGSPLIETDLTSLEIDPSRFGTTEALVSGVLRGIEDRGYKTGGFNCYVTSDVLIGAGLSSSAAFETLIATVVSGLYNDMAITPAEAAMIGQFAENRFFGKPCGLMDQMACSLGSLVHIDFKDPEDPVVEQLSLDLDKHQFSLCITDTKGSHSDLTDDYSAVPREMRSVAQVLGEDYLIRVPYTDVLDNIGMIREKCGDRAVLRALHFYGEDMRVQRITEAIKNDDIDAFLSCIRESGDSSYKYLQNVYTCHDITHQNVSIALCVSGIILSGGKGVARVHGGGFAGTIQAFVRNEAVEEYRSRMDELFGEGSCSILKIRSHGGIRVI